MKENITARVGRIVSASVNALVDAVENVAPEMVMEEAIRDVDGVIDEVRAELGKVIANKHLAEQRLSEGKARHADLTEKARLAVTEGRDDLAEAAIAQQMDIEAQLPVLEKASVEANAKEKELEGYINALQAKRREMREEMRRFAESRKETVASAPAGTVSGSGPDFAGKVAKAGSTFDRLMEKNTGLPGAPSTPGTAAKLAELEDLARQNRIRERLAALKSTDE